MTVNTLSELFRDGDANEGCGDVPRSGMHLRYLDEKARHELGVPLVQGRGDSTVEAWSKVASNYEHRAARAAAFVRRLEDAARAARFMADNWSTLEPTR